MKKDILVLYYTRGVYPLRDTVRTHLYCWRNYSAHRVHYVNVALGFPWRLIRRLNVDVIIYHTIFLSMRWSPEIFEKFTRICAPLDDFECTKIALPQDEFMRSDMLALYLAKVGVTHVGTCAYPEDWPKIYRHLGGRPVTFRTVLTGYLDEATVRRIDRRKSAVRRRDIDIGYRAWRAEFWLGEHGMHKVWVADRFKRPAETAGLKTDISLRNEDVLAGDDWFDFLLRCRSTLGVEGGASVLDSAGTIKQRVDAYVADNPGATFEETRAVCFPNDDNRLRLACISPRHLEACATETCQLLIEGRYNDILEPGKHYIVIKRDYSNLPEVMRALHDHERLAGIARKAYDDLVRSGRWTYRRFVAELERDIIDPVPARQRQTSLIVAALAGWLLRLRDYLTWQFIRTEVKLLSMRSTTARRAVGALNFFLTRALHLSSP